LELQTVMCYIALRRNSSQTGAVSLFESYWVSESFWVSESSWLFQTAYTTTARKDCITS